jgi:hypothetical protein
VVGPIADFVVSLSNDGHVVSQGSVREAIARDPVLAEEVKHEEEAIELDEIEELQVKTDKPTDSKKCQLVVAEEIAVGRISLSACGYLLPFLKPRVTHPVLVKLFLGGFGGRFPVFYWLNFITSETLSDIFDVLEMWWLGYWAQKYLTSDPSKISTAL